MNDTPRQKTLADLSKDEQGQIRAGEAMERMIATDEWKFYQKVLESHLDRNRFTMENQIPDGQVDGASHALRTEHLKGTIIALRLALGLPAIMIKTSQDMKQRLLGTGADT